MIKVLLTQVIGAIVMVVFMMLCSVPTSFENTRTAILCAAMFGALIGGQWALGDGK